MHAFSVVGLVVCLSLAAAAPVGDTLWGDAITDKRDVQYTHPDSVITDKRASDVQYKHYNDHATDKRQSDVQYKHYNDHATDKRQSDVQYKHYNDHATD
ncbi:hypothetical protein E4U40_002691 [Claviceps sp. LM458 group G5]|nr:hypothetical protein E4U40_002691 [Claviceps sp. LM458 group G5]